MPQNLWRKREDKVVEKVSKSLSVSACFYIDCKFWILWTAECAKLAEENNKKRKSAAAITFGSYRLVSTKGSQTASTAVSPPVFLLTELMCLMWHHMFHLLNDNVNQLNWHDEIWAPSGDWMTWCFPSYSFDSFFPHELISYALSNKLFSWLHLKTLTHWHLSIIWRYNMQATIGH